MQHKNKSRPSRSSTPAHTDASSNKAADPAIQDILFRQPQTWTSKDITYLQRTLGNTQVLRLLQRDTQGETSDEEMNEGGTDETDGWAELKGRYPNMKEWTNKPWEKPASRPDWDEAQAQRHLAEFKRRVSEMPPLNNDTFIGMVERYIDALRQADTKQISLQINAMTTYLKQQRAFQVQKDVYIRESQGKTFVPNSIRQAANKQVNVGHLWSKLSQFPSIEAVQGQDAISLEASAAGSLFDGLTFGRHRTDPLLRKQWKMVSKTFVKNLRGVVHVMMFGGIFDGSVFYTTELPIIKRKMDDGVIQSCYVYIYEYDKVKDDMAPKGDPIEIRKVGDWEKVPRIDKPTSEWYEQQARVDAKNTHRYKAKAVFEAIEDRQLAEAQNT